jgi:hypothetical protein
MRNGGEKIKGQDMTKNKNVENFKNKERIKGG